MSAHPTSLLWHPALSKIKKRVKSVEYNPLGAREVEEAGIPWPWAFVECWDGTAFWVHLESEIVVPSCRNDFPDVKKKPVGSAGRGE